MRVLIAAVNRKSTHQLEFIVFLQFSIEYHKIKHPKAFHICRKNQRFKSPIYSDFAALQHQN